MTPPPTPYRTASYQHRAYMAEAAAQLELEAGGQLLGWANHDDLAAFHDDFAPPWFRTGPPPTLRQGTGSASSRYYASGHVLKVLARDRHVLGYTHELAHAVNSGRGNGHHPRWAGAYLAMLAYIDPSAAAVLRVHMGRARLTIEPWRQLVPRPR